MMFGLFEKAYLKKKIASEPCHASPHHSLCLFPILSLSCNTKGLLASFTHYTCIRFFFLSLFLHISFLLVFFVLKLYHTVHTSSPPPCFFRDRKEPHCVFFIFCFLLSLWLITPFLCMRECITISLIHSTAGTLSAMTHDYSPHA